MGVDMKDILLVEDSKLFARVVTKNVEKQLDARVVHADELRKVPPILRERDIFAALLDLSLPDAPQGEVVDYVLDQGTPSIVYSGKFDSSLREKILAKNAVDYLLKENANCVQEMISILDRLHKNQHINILVVDDQAVVRRELRKSLTAYGFRVSEARDGQEALQYLECGGVDLVITDFQMPGLDGLEFLQKIRSKYSHTDLPVLGVSGYQDKDLAVRFLKYGANDFLLKPFTREEVQTRVLHQVETLERIQNLQMLNNTKNLFLGTVAHDLRTPLHSIKGFTSMLLDEMAGSINQEQGEYLSLLQDSASSMLDLVNSLLDLSSVEQGKIVLDLKPGDLSAVVKKRIRLQQPIAESKKISFEEHIQDIAGLVFDAERMNQVVDNLLGNAIKFSPSGSIIRVFLHQAYGHAELRIQDQGPGIEPQEQKKLFQIFHSGTARGTDGEKSTGLGLAIVNEMVKAHKGQIKVESVPGGGSEFVVYIPLS